MHENFPIPFVAKLKWSEADVVASEKVASVRFEFLVDPHNPMICFTKELFILRMGHQRSTSSCYCVTVIWRCYALGGELKRQALPFLNTICPRGVVQKIWECQTMRF